MASDGLNDAFGGAAVAEGAAARNHALIGLGIFHQFGRCNHDIFSLHPDRLYPGRFQIIGKLNSKKLNTAAAIANAIAPNTL